MCPENVSQTFSSKRRLAVNRGNRWSEFGVNYNVFGIGHTLIINKNNLKKLLIINN